MSGAGILDDATVGTVRALAWLLGHSPTLGPIPGTSSIAYLDDNVDAAWLSLVDRDLAALDTTGTGAV